MKYKHVFFIWLLADAFLALGLLGFTIYELNTTYGSYDDLEMFMWITFYGIIVSLPSLCTMLLFHWIYSSNTKDRSYNSIPYIMLIISINIVYLFIGQFVFDMSPEFNIFYLGSTAAGLLAFYLVNRKVRKKVVVENLQNPAA